MTQRFLTHLRFLEGGYCRQLARLAGANSWRWIRFPAVFLHFEHPIHGAALIDTAYSSHFLEATQSFPERLYRWLTPVNLRGKEDAAETMRSCGLDPASVRRIFLSHFHADHIAGLKCFSTPELIYREETYHRLQRESRMNRLHHGFLCGLVPSDFEKRGRGLVESQFHRGTGLLESFLICDYWNDGSLILVDLPGHADGHLGFLLQTDTETVFYIVDACWHLDVLFSGATLPWVSRQVQSNWSEYQMTQKKLRELRQKTDWKFFACHCPQTGERVGNAQD